MVDHDNEQVTEEDIAEDKNEEFDNLSNQSSDAAADATEKDRPTAEEFAEQQDRILRLHAEMENLRGRTAREIADQRKYGSISLLRDLLPVIDNIDRAIESALQATESEPQESERSESKSSQTQNSDGLLEGFRLVRQQLLSILEQHHCKPIEALGKPFDPLLHEAILQQPSEDQPKDYVMMVSQGGYRLHDRVVQPSKVIVSSGPFPQES